MTQTLEPPSKLYVPVDGITLDKAPLPQQRVGIQGYPGTGKSWSALTWPNTVVLNTNRGLGAHRGRSDVIEIPIYDPDLVVKLTKNPTMFKDAALKWIKTEAPKLSREQTLVVDCLSDLESWYHSDWKLRPVISVRSGKIDDYAEWGNKIEYFGDMMDTLVTLRCHVIMLTHESEAKNKQGEYTGKVRPILNGAYGDKLVGKFTDWFRQLSAEKPKDFSALKDTDIQKTWSMSVKEFEAMCNTFTGNTIYYWQTRGDNIFDGKCSSLVNFPHYIPANYESFCKYLRK